MQPSPRTAARSEFSVPELNKIALRQWLDEFSGELNLTRSLVSVAADALQDHLPNSARDDKHHRNLDLLTIAERMTRANIEALEHLINNPPTIQDSPVEGSSQE